MLIRHAILTAVLLAGLGLSGCALMLGKSSGTLPPAVAQDLKACNIVWDSPSRDSFDSMPLPGAQGAGAIVWVQDGSLWIYLAHNGAYDESGTLLKLGCLRLTPAGLDWRDPLAFKQAQDLASGTITVESTARDGTRLRLRLRFLGETLLVDSFASREIAWDVSYGTWRDADKRDPYSGGRADLVTAAGDALHFVHRDGDTAYEANMAHQQNVPPADLLNLLTGRNFGGALVARGGLTFAVAGPVAWQAWKGKAWPGKTVTAKEHRLAVTLGAAKAADPTQWEATARALLAPVARAAAEQAEDKRWSDFWSRSYIFVAPQGGPKDPAFQVGRDYQLFHQMLACNRGGELPLKFNGGIFTTEAYPGRVPARLNNASLTPVAPTDTTPDYRRWGQMFMSQNQRWLGWPTLAAGDADLLAPTIAFYRNRLPVAQARAKNIGADGACYAEPLELAGMVCVAPNGQGLCNAPHLYHHFSMGLEHAWMALQGHDMLNTRIDADIPWLVEVVRFFDSFYRAQTRQRTQQELGADGKLEIYPANSLELLGGATDPIEVVAGLRRVTEGLLLLPQLPTADRAYLTQMQKTLPDLPTMTRAGKQVLAPAAKWEHEYNPWEFPEMYAAWPFRLVGVTQPETLALVRDTWDTLGPRGDNRSQVFAKLDFSWQATVANVAALGRPDEAQTRVIAKLSDAASCCRYPAFFGPGHDWMPDHNWGGSGMVGLQEMLLAAEPGPRGKICLLPAWPKAWDVRFRLHTAGQTLVEGEVRNGRLTRLSVDPPGRLKNVVLATGWQMP